MAYLPSGITLTYTTGRAALTRLACPKYLPQAGILHLPYYKGKTLHLRQAKVPPPKKILPVPTPRSRPYKPQTQPSTAYASPSTGTKNLVFSFSCLKILRFYCFPPCRHRTYWRGHGAFIRNKHHASQLVSIPFSGYKIIFFPHIGIRHKITNDRINLTKIHFPTRFPSYIMPYSFLPLKRRIRIGHIKSPDWKPTVSIRTQSK